MWILGGHIEASAAFKKHPGSLRSKLETPLQSSAFLCASASCVE
jgi:hypothetical protein